MDAAMKDDLMTEVDKVLILHSKSWIASFDRRFLPYMSIFDAMELIDPTAPEKEIMPEVWDAVKMICICFDLNFAETRERFAQCAATQKTWAGRIHGYAKKIY